MEEIPGGFVQVFELLLTIHHVQMWPVLRLDQPGLMAKSGSEPEATILWFKSLFSMFIFLSSLHQETKKLIWVGEEEWK